MDDNETITVDQGNDSVSAPDTPTTGEENTNTVTDSEPDEASQINEYPSQKGTPPDYKKKKKPPLPSEKSDGSIPAKDGQPPVAGDDQYPIDDDAEETTDENPVSGDANVPGCYEMASDACTSFSPYDSPECFIKKINAEIESNAAINTTYYVAITQGEYQAQGLQGCPFSGTVCPWGSDTNDGLTPEKPLATFKEAFSRMKDHKEANGKTGHYTLSIRGGKFTYSEPIVVTAYAFYGAQMYKGPFLYDSNGNQVKGNTTTYEVSYYGDSDYADAKAYIISDISIKPHQNESVTIDGGCAFTPPTGSDGQPVVFGHSEWDVDDTAMMRTCASPRWKDPITDPYTAGFFGTMGMISIHNAHRITVEDINVINAPTFGIVIYGVSDHVVIKNNNISNTYASGVAAMFGPQNVIIDGNDVSYACAGSAQENISAKANVSHVAIINNRVTNSYNDAAIDVSTGYHHVYVGHNEVIGATTGGIYVEAQNVDSDHVWIDGNRIHDSVYGDCIRLASEQRANTEDVKITSNVCYNTLRGIWIAGYFHLIGENAKLDPTVVGVPMHNVSVLNNTVYGTGNELMGFGSGFAMSNPGATNVVVENNIFSTSYKNTVSFQYVLRDDGTLNSDIIEFKNNITFCSDSVEKDEEGNLKCLSDNAKEMPVAGNYQFDPLFADPENGDFHLSNDSTAIDAGSHNTDAPDYDFECDLRLFDDNTTVDIGADEYY
ncbi:MAG TPA: DUF5123 domain-containing protein [bacterium]|nr:DUF5123 domain-containing protein [bacterium]